jgi:hypothetical protein
MKQVRNGKHNVLVAMRCPDELITRIDFVADSLGMKRSDVARNLIQMGLEDAELMDKVGILKGYKYFRDMIRQLGQEEQTEREV